MDHTPLVLNTSFLFYVSRVATARRSCLSHCLEQLRERRGTKLYRPKRISFGMNMGNNDKFQQRRPRHTYVFSASSMLHNRPPKNTCKIQTRINHKARSQSHRPEGGESAEAGRRPDCCRPHIEFEQRQQLGRAKVAAREGHRVCR